MAAGRVRGGPATHVHPDARYLPRAAVRVCVFS